jgi:hypothetical protein
MSYINGMPVNFTISDAAKTEIASMRSIWFSMSGHKPGVLSIAWGTANYNNGKTNSFAIVSFYDEEQHDEIKHGIEMVSGLEVLFFITRENYDRFAGKVLDHSAEQSFYLTDPAEETKRFAHGTISF